MTEIKRSPRAALWLALLALLPLAIAACTADEEDAPLEQPAIIISEARLNTSRLDSFHFYGNVVLTQRDEDDGDWLELYPPDGSSGEASGNWVEDIGWAAEIFGFGMGRGIVDRVVAVSNGQTVLMRESADDEWQEPGDLQAEIPTPDSWLYVFDLEDLHLLSTDGVVNGEEVYHLAATRIRGIETLPPIFQETASPDDPTVAETYTIFISHDDLQVVRLMAAVNTGGKSQIRTWNFEQHNEDVEVNLPDELEQ